MSGQPLAREPATAGGAIRATVRGSLGPPVGNVPVGLRWYGSAVLFASPVGDRLSVGRKEITEVHTNGEGRLLLCHLPAGELVIVAELDAPIVTDRIWIADLDRLIDKEPALALRTYGPR